MENFNCLSMINRLRIRDFAIIDTLDIQFAPGFLVLTGETGAGKSIIIDAIALLLGDRASLEVIRSGKDVAFIEGEFNIEHNVQVQGILSENGWESSGELIICREISRSGKSHAFLDGRMVPVSLLNKLGKFLVDIHGQHDHQSLFSTQTQRDILDKYGNLESLTSIVEKNHAGYQKVKNDTINLERTKVERARQIDLIQYQLSEIEQAKISDPEEMDLLVRERDRLLHAGKLALTTQQASHELFEGENSVFDKVSAVKNQLTELVQYDSDLEKWVEKLDNAAIQLQDTAESCRAYSDSIDNDPDRLEEIELREEILRTLKKKYGPELEDVLDFYEKHKLELEKLISIEADNNDLLNRLTRTEKILADTSAELSEKRKKTSSKLEPRIEELLNKLGMPKSRFKVAFGSDPEPVHSSDGFLSEQYTSHGYDSIEFRISTNPDENYKPLNKIVSGGELSRIMLALKSLLADHDSIPSMVFDEIDQGIGGPTAEIVGQVIKSVSNNRQVLCITHLAQIAFQADNHLFVEKTTRKSKTTVKITELQKSDRVAELARMMGGIKTSAEIKHYAEKLLGDQ